MIPASLALFLLPPQIIGQAPQVLGPFVGNLGPRSASVLVRFDHRDPARLSLVDASGRVIQDFPVSPTLEQDKCVRWELGSLEPDTSYTVTVRGDRTFFKTPAENEKKVSIAFGSCADDRPGLPNPVWAAIAKDAPDVLILSGDAPFIDSTDLEMQRRRYVEFLANPELTKLLQQTTFLATWGEHDFAKEGADGTTAGKQNSRKAFLEHHVNPGAGEESQGIYTRYRRGPVDVFLLDTRWFSGTEKSFADPAKPTLIGAKQWAWLQRELEGSKAPFKILVSGMAWSDATTTPKSASWAAFPWERAAVFGFVAEKKIEGVVLVGGDQRRSRVVLHPPEATGVAYPLRELDSSPLGGGPAAEPAAAGPSVLFDKSEANSWLVLSADASQKPAWLQASFRSAASGETHKLEIAADELRPHTAIVPAAREDDGGRKRTQEVLARAKSGAADLVFLGDSITEGWEDAGKEVWEKSCAPRKALNLGVGGDRTQHVLWRIEHGQLDGLHPKLVVLMIGTNNSNGEDNTASEIAGGIEEIVGRIRRKLPEAKVLLLAIFPRGEKPGPQRSKNDEASHLAASAVADGKTVQFLDIGPSFLSKDGALAKDVMPDALHPNAKGYGIWAQAIEGKLVELLGK